ncbi:hypothetical protein [Streptomyces sp. BBFR102]|uniref:hypothetical protein n=1 Tax=Streptomyces sp. BBFR102 TaxID=3448171 RepID=UPI003F53209D
MSSASAVPRRAGPARRWITEAGGAARAGPQARSPQGRAETHAGTTDADRATPLRVLMRLTHNAVATVPVL